MASSATRSGAAPDSGAARAAIAAAGVTVVLWASAFVSIRHVGSTFSPGALALGRLLVGSLVLGAVVAWRRDLRRPSRRDALAILFYGVLWFAGYNVALNAAEQHLDAGTSAMLVNVGPILLAVLAGVLLHEGFPRPLVAGTGVAVIGAAVIGLAAADGRHTDLVGVGLALLAAVLYAAGVTAQKPALANTSALSATWLGCTIGAVACLPFAPQLVHQTAAASVSDVANVVYLGAFPTAIAFTTWAFALARTTAGRMGATTYLVPVVATLMAWPVLGETPPPLALVGGALCLVGVAVTRRRATVRTRGSDPVAAGTNASQEATDAR